jgi:acetyl-CoA carboxylase beta subunit
MSEKIRQFIDQLAAGQAAEAKDTLENELAARSFGALDEYKKEIAQSIFGGNQETEEETSEEELLTQEEFDALSEEEQEMYLESLEQLNELSPALKKRYIMKADKSANKLDDDTWNKSPQNYTPADKIKRQKLNIRKQGMERAYKSFDVK